MKDLGSQEALARSFDEKDPLRSFREEFLFPKAPSGDPVVYLVGNSLGLQPRRTAQYVNQELEDWARLGVEGHLQARHPWYPYHEFLTEATARVVGAIPSEVVTMNALTVNLHLLMVSFYRPSAQRYRILIEEGAFPSDRYAVASQAAFHGFDPGKTILTAAPRPGETTLRTEDILSTIDRHGGEIALVLMGGVNYLTGQAFAMKEITLAAQGKGCLVGWDLAHAAGNLVLALHDWNVDFAAWCTYKYLNAGPGGVGGAFVHERHATTDRPRFAGWWGHDKVARFQMSPQFSPMKGAEGWQLSNPPILQMAALRASLELFDKATMTALGAKSGKLTGFLESLLLDGLGDGVTVVTPKNPAERGAQLSLRVKRGGKELHQRLKTEGVVCDFREPDIIRAAPAPLYCSFTDVFRFGGSLRKALVR